MLHLHFLPSLVPCSCEEFKYVDKKLTPSTFRRVDPLRYKLNKSIHRRPPASGAKKTTLGIILSSETNGRPAHRAMSGRRTRQGTKNPFTTAEGLIRRPLNARFHGFHEVLTAIRRRRAEPMKGRSQSPRMRQHTSIKKEHKQTVKKRVSWNRKAYFRSDEGKCNENITAQQKTPPQLRRNSNKSIAANRTQR